MVKKENIKKVMKGITLGIGVSVFTILIILVVFIILFFVGGPVEVTKGAQNYESTMKKYTKEAPGQVHTGFFSFPETIPTSAFTDGKEPSFYFSYKDTWDDPTCEVYLECEYSAEEYEKEIQRLNDTVYIDKDYPQNERKLIYEDGNRFEKPVFIAIDKSNHSYEYAMVLGDNKIAYIYTSFKTNPKKIKKIPHEYLPANYEESLKNVKFGDGFNVYEVSKGEDFIVLDYER